MVNEVRYWKYVNSCTGRLRYVKPGKLVDIFASPALTSNRKYTVCKSKSSGSIFKESAKNATVSGGVKYGGANLSAQAGWGKKVRIEFEFDGPGRICGNKGDSWLDAPIVVARPPA